ncbi:hypothetical protein H8959_009679 [Pygathrix nigripes]
MRTSQGNLRTQHSSGRGFLLNLAHIWMWRRGSRSVKDPSRVIDVIMKPQEGAMQHKRLWMLLAVSAVLFNSTLEDIGTGIDFSSSGLTVDFKAMLTVSGIGLICPVESLLPGELRGKHEIFSSDISKENLSTKHMVFLQRPAIINIHRQRGRCRGVPLGSHIPQLQVTPSAVRKSMSALLVLLPQ